MSKLNLKMYPPDKDLEKYIQCYWILDDDFCKDKVLRQKIISDGSNGVVFNLALPMDIDVGEEKTRCPWGRKNLSDVFITGSTIKPTYLRLKGETKLIGIRFNFGGSYPFFQDTLNKYIDKVIKFDSLEWNKVLDDLKDATQVDEMIKILDKFLLQIILKDKVELTTWVLNVIKPIIASDGNITKEALCKQFDISQRQLERRFKEVIGLSVKQISMIIRTHKSRELIREDNFTTLTEIGYACNYFDQAHFIKEFKKLTDTTPKLYYKQKTHLS